MCDDTSTEDLCDGMIVPTIYRCLSRSFSVGSQLSAAAASTTIHEESLGDLTLDAAAARSDYLPMSGIGSAAREKSGTVAGQSSASAARVKSSPLLSGPEPSSASRQSEATRGEKSPLLSGSRSDAGMVSEPSVNAATRGQKTLPVAVHSNTNTVPHQSAPTDSEELPLVPGRTDVSSVSRQSAAARGTSENSPLLSAPTPASVSHQSLGLTSRASDSAMVVPSSGSARYHSGRDESGYLLFRPTGFAATGDGGSLERLGPPPEIPTSAADYIMPALPPKQRPKSGQRANSLLLSGRPQIPARRRGSADSWGAAPTSLGLAVPPRENRDSPGISAPSAGIPVRSATERRRPRKPTLTVDAIASANSICTGEQLFDLVEN